GTGFGDARQLVQIQPQPFANPYEQLSADRSFVVLDEIEISGRDADSLRQRGLGEAERQPFASDLDADWRAHRLLPVQTFTIVALQKKGKLQKKIYITKGYCIVVLGSALLCEAIAIVEESEDDQIPHDQTRHPQGCRGGARDVGSTLCFYQGRMGGGILQRPVQGACGIRFQRAADRLLHRGGTGPAQGLPACGQAY